MSNEKLQMFTERYDAKQTPWDTGITPPEIVQIVQDLPAGKAIDLGCGTGTNVRYFVEHGWIADGVDFVPQAINIAKEKLADFPAEKYGVFCHDVTQLETCVGLRPTYDLAVDIGCGHGVVMDRQPDYVKGVAAMLRQGGVFMLFAHEPSETRKSGWTPDDVKRLFTPYFDLAWQILNKDTTTGSPSGWYQLIRKCVPG